MLQGVKTAINMLRYNNIWNFSSPMSTSCLNDLFLRHIIHACMHIIRHIMPKSCDVFTSVYDQQIKFLQMGQQSKVDSWLLRANINFKVLNFEILST